MLKKGTEIQFKQMNNFTGEIMKYQGRIIGHAKEVRKMWPGECGEVINPVYLVRREDPYGNTFHHMVFPEEFFFEDKFKQVRIMQTYKAKVRADKEKKRREYYFK